jgi:hypothetical protein
MDRPLNDPRRLRLPLVVAVLVAVVALALSAHRSAGAETQLHMKMATSAAVTPDQLAFRNQMRVLWEQHVAWTRLAIVSFAGDLPDLAATEQRLLRNQVDIGAAIAPFYGDLAGHRLTVLLRHHILIAVDILVDARAGDQATLAVDLDRWTLNANRIAAFLHDANPKQWPLDEMRRMMHRHLALTTREAVAQLGGDFAGGVRAYDSVEHEILGMADMVSTGILAQFPGRFA